MPYFYSGIRANKDCPILLFQSTFGSAIPKIISLLQQKTYISSRIIKLRRFSLGTEPKGSFLFIQIPIKNLSRIVVGESA